MKRYISQLTKEEQQYLHRITTQGHVLAHGRVHAHILLKAHADQMDIKIAKHLNVEIYSME